MALDDAAPLVDEEECVTVLEGTFVAASKNEFVLRHGDKSTWACIAPGAHACLA